MKKIAFDVMGNDHGVEAGVKASIKFLKSNPDYEITLVGDEKEISKFYDKSNHQLKIMHEINIAKKGDANLRTIVKEKNSMTVALDLIIDNQADAILSSGDSATYLSAATLKLKRMEGILRPAFMPMIPTMNDNEFFLMLDVGANLEVKAEFLHQWGKIAKIFYQVLFGKENPKVGLINIGTEDYKGFEFHKEANELLKADKDLNYSGFVETRNILKGEVDVVLADGYAGNITLKTLEGSILDFSKLIKRKLTKNIFRKLMALCLKSTFKEVKEHFDYRNVGAAWVVGVNGVVIKSHGSSDEKAYLGALNQIKLALDNDVLNKVKKAIL